MLGQLPQTLNVGGKDYEIRTDFRSTLRIIEALADDELTPQDKVYVVLKQTYKDFYSIPSADYVEAYEQAMWFINCGDEPSERESKKIIDWSKDEQLIFPAINKVAGQEVRSAKYMHWWTFLGFFRSIDRDDTYGYVLMLRQKRAKGKPFEKWESEYWNNNRDICDLNMTSSSGKEAEDAIAAIYKELLKGGGG